MDELRQRWMRDTAVSGAIPETLGMMTNIEVIRWANNAFTGPLPESLFDLTNMTILNLRGNNLDGTLEPGG